MSVRWVRYADTMERPRVPVASAVDALVKRARSPVWFLEDIAAHKVGGECRAPSVIDPALECILPVSDPWHLHHHVNHVQAPRRGARSMRQPRPARVVYSTTRRVPGMSMRRSRRVVKQRGDGDGDHAECNGGEHGAGGDDDVECHVGHGRAHRGRDDPAVQEQPGAHADCGAEQPDQQLLPPSRGPGRVAAACRRRRGWPVPGRVRRR